jgi:hypothetical protein
MNKKVKLIVNLDTHKTRHQLADVMRWTKDIGMFTLDRSREDSCIHKTDFCDTTCFNNKLEIAFKHAIEPKDIKNDEAWYNNDTKGLAKALSRKRNQTSRVRLMSRGEAFKDITDTVRVMRILRDNPDSIFWIPTRAWRDKELWDKIKDIPKLFNNVRILWSFDPSNSISDWKLSVDSGQSVMFYGDDELLSDPVTKERMFKCPKTHKKLDGHCNICKGGCFRADKRVIVHLKQH